MPMPGQFLKDPTAVLDYAVDWTAWLTDDDTITAATWNVPTGLTASRQSSTSSVATTYLSGGTAGRNYDVTVEITTTAGRTDARSITIICIDR